MTPTPRIPTTGHHALDQWKHSYLTLGGLGLNFQRTCRVPVGQRNSLPAGLGNFPVYKVQDFRSGCPKEWQEGGYFFPMYRQEAMWINFQRGYHEQPKALIIGAGNINAVTGKPFDPTKDKMGRAEGGKRGKKGKKGKQKVQTGQAGLDIKLEKEQNYLIVPPQPWLDGWKAEDNKVYQFVAAEMGSGETVEGQITGEEVIGGIQFIVYDPKPGQKLIPTTRPHEYINGGSYAGLGDVDAICFDDICCLEEFSPVVKPLVPESLDMLCANTNSFRGASSKGPVVRRVSTVRAMGLGRGGEIDQKIYPDPHGLGVWNEKPTVVEVVYMVSSEDFKQITGHPAPPTPVTYEKYQQLGLPWFELHDQKYKDTEGSDIFAKLKPVGEGKAKGEEKAKQIGT